MKPFHLVSNRVYPQFQYAGDFKEEIISVLSHQIDVTSFVKDEEIINGLPQYLQFPKIPIVLISKLILFIDFSFYY